MADEDEIKVPGQQRPDWEQISKELAEILDPEEKEMRNGKCRLSVELSPAEKTELERQARSLSEELHVDFSVSQYVRWLIRNNAKKEA